MEDWNGEDWTKFLVGLFAVGCGILLCILGWVYVFGPLFNQADYNTYNNSQQHVNAIAQRFANDCMQLAETSDPVAKKTIEQDIYSQASTVDVEAMQMPYPVRACVNRAINDVSSGK